MLIDMVHSQATELLNQSDSLGMTLQTAISSYEGIQTSRVKRRERDPPITVHGPYILSFKSQKIGICVPSYSPSRYLPLYAQSPDLF